jgi:hypothetical protein
LQGPEINRKSAAPAIRSEKKAKIASKPTAGINLMRALSGLIIRILTHLMFLVFSFQFLVNSFKERGDHQACGDCAIIIEEPCISRSRKRPLNGHDPQNHKPSQRYLKFQIKEQGARSKEGGIF